MNKLLKLFSPLALVTVIVPTFLALLYFGLFAQDIYISEARVVVRNPNEKSTSALDVALNQTGFGSANEGNDTVVAYLESRQAISDGDKEGAIKGAYTRDDIFWLDRFGSIWGESDEEFYRYFQSKIEVDEGTTTQVLTISVSAFDPLEAQSINQQLVAQSEALVNSLSNRAQSDLIEVAQEEVTEAVEIARQAALELAQYRQSSGIVDPQLQSEAALQMVGKIQDELIAAKTQLRQLQTYTPQASQIPFLRTQIRELEAEIAQVRSEVTGGRESLSGAMAKYQELLVNAELAEKQVELARAGLLDARAEARRQQSYLEQVSQPSLPDYPVEPRRIRSIIATLILGLLAWGVFTMLAIGVREHRD